MVAIISGSELGLFNTTLAGGHGASGAGRGGEGLYVNTATGNLVVQQTDERLSALGIDLALVRTYNSRGEMDDDNGDNWRLGVEQRVHSLTGWRNVFGTVTKTFGDGAEIVYEYDILRGAYVATDGDGAHDTLVWTGGWFGSGEWIWTDGSTGASETYDSNGRLIAKRDAHGNTVTYGYTSGRLTRITDASGQTTYLDYSGSNLARVRVVSAGRTETLTRYYYDSLNRLTQVVVDLSPEDNAVPLQDGNGDGAYDTITGETYVTRYTYEGTSRRISSIQQGDGTEVRFTYQSINGGQRLRTVTVVTAAGNRTTTFTYSSYNSGGQVYLQTNVTDPLGRVTTYRHDTAGRLTAVLSPAVDGTRFETRYEYDPNGQGNLVRVIEDPNGLNRVTTYEYDANGNLTLSRDALGNTVTRTYDPFTNQLLTETQYRVRDPDGAGSAQPGEPLTTRYAYDLGNHLRFIVSPEGRVTEHQYDLLTGNRTTTLRYIGATYDVSGLAPNQALDEFTLGLWAVSQDHTQLERLDYAYDFRGQLTSTTAWASTGDFGVGTGTPSVTRFVYDQRGNLLQTIDARGTDSPNPQNPSLPYASTYAYDGLGRLLSSVDWIEAGVSRTLLTQYDDANNRTVTTLENGPNTLITTETYNRAGELTSVQQTNPAAEPLGATTYRYDVNGNLRIVTDATGISTFALYDEANRKIADIDGDGTVTEYVYNDLSEVVKTIRYATALDGALLRAGQANSLVDANGEPTGVALATIRPATTLQDQITRSVYDSAGRLVYTMTLAHYDSGTQTFHYDVTETRYDGAGRADTVIAYATRLALPASAGELRPGSGERQLVDAATGATYQISENSTDDRRTRYFYDADGHLLATLDPEGYLSESIYDPAGRLTETVAYANAVPVALLPDAVDETLRRTGTLEELRDAVGFDSAADARSYFFYDGQGRQIGHLDAEGYLSEIEYDLAGRVAARRRYDPYDASGGRIFALYMPGFTTFEALREAVLSAAVLVTHGVEYTYDGVGRLQTETNHEGTVTTYSYDAAGNLTSTTRAVGATNRFGEDDSRTARVRYDALGRVHMELSGEGSKALEAALTALPPPSDADIEALWARYGTTYAYDAAGRRISARAIAANPFTGTEQELVTYYYYDEDNRLRFEVSGEGDVREHIYNDLGQLEATLSYAARISIDNLSGGLITREDDALRARLTPTRDPERDAETRYTYTLTGQVASTRTAEGAALLGEAGANTTHVYNAFGEEQSQIVAIDGTRRRESVFDYDRRGLLTTTHTDTEGFDLETSQTYDAFGRVVSMTDPRQNTMRFEYDRLGRTVVTEDALGHRRTATYDAFDRVLTTRDALGHETVYQYQDAARSTLVTTPEGVSVWTVRNAHGETLHVLHGDNLTTYDYDADGQLLRTSDILGSLESRAYDSQGRQVEARDGEGNLTCFEYDAANRLLARHVELGGGVRLTTTYEYDGQGRVIRVTEPGSRVTETDYDADGRIVEVRVDPDGLNLRTQFEEYDLEGRVLRVTEGVGTATPRTVEYRYDTLGRRTHDIVDPDGLALTTEYRYDANGNVVRRIDPRGNSTWYVYDAKSRLTHSVNALGEVSETTYDAEDRVIRTRQSYSRISTAGFGDSIAAPAVPWDSRDRVTQILHDRDGRVRYTISSVGTVTEQTYDVKGNVTRVRSFEKPVLVLHPEGTFNIYYTTIAQLEDMIEAVGNSLTTLAAGDRVSWSAYDQRGRLAFAVDGTGAVVRYEYDRSDNLTAQTAYATRRTPTLPMELPDLNAWLDEQDHTQPAGVSHAQNPKNQTTRYWYDAANRARFTLDPEGYLRETRYVDGAREEIRIVYMGGPVTFDANASVADVEARVDTIRNPAIDQQTVTLTDGAGRIVRVIDAEGYRTEYAYDASGNRTVVSQALNQAATLWATTRHYYDGANREVYRRSAEGYLTEYRYDATGNLEARLQYETRVNVPALGFPQPIGGDRVRVTQFSYDAAGRLETERNAANVVTRHEYDAHGNRIRTTEAEGTGDERVTTYDYDSAGRMYQTTRAVGEAEEITTRLVLDAFGNVTARYEAYGTDEQRNFSFAYDRNDRVLLEVDALLVPTINAYDAFGNLEASFSAFTSGDIRVESFTYDRRNLMRTATNGAGEVTEYHYDANGNRTAIINANAVPVTGSDEAYYQEWRRRFGVSVTVGGVERGKTVAELTAADIELLRQYCTAVYTFDRNNRLETVTDPEGVSTRYRYDGAGNKKETIQAEGRGAEERHSFYDYDLDNRITRVTDPMGGVTEYRYDALGNQTQIIDANGGVRINTFDALGRLETSLSPGGVLIRNTYDARGNVRSTTQSWANGSDSRTTTYEYDVLDRQTRVTDGEGYSTVSTYDLFGNRRTVTVGEYLVEEGDPVYTFSQEKADRAHPQTTIFTYDGAGRVRTETDGEGNVTIYTRDSYGNVKSITEAANGFTSTVRTTPRTTVYTYDGADRVKTVTTPMNGVTEYVYDKLGNVIEERVLQSGSAYFSNASYYVVQAGDTWDSIAIRLYGTSGADTVMVVNQLKADYGDAVPPVGTRLTNLRAQISTTYTTLENVPAYYRVPNGATWESIADALYHPGNDLFRAQVVGQLKQIYGNAVPQAGAALRDLPPSLTVYTGGSIGAEGSWIPGGGTSTGGPIAVAYVLGLDASALSTTESVPQGNTFNINLDAITVGVWIVRRYEYDRDSRLTAEIIPLTSTELTRTEHQYDSVGNRTRTHFAVGTADQRSIGMEYDLNNRKTADLAYLYDAAGNVDPFNWARTEYGYDAVGNRTKVTNAMGYAARYYYNADNQLICILDAERYINTFQYDSAGNQTEVRVDMFALPLGTEIDDRIPPPSPRSSSDRITIFEYDRANRLRARVTSDGPINEDPAFTRTEYVYDGAGNRITETLFANTPNPRVKRFYYDDAGRLVVFTDVDNTNTLYVYDAAGNIVEETLFNLTSFDPFNATAAYPADPHIARRKRYEYDLNNRRIAEIIDPSYEGYQGLDIRRETDYDHLDNVMATRVNATQDGKYTPTENFYYDLNNRLVTRFDQTTNVTTFGYDRIGNRTSVTDARGFTTDYVYDLNNRLIREIQPAHVVFTIEGGSRTERPETRYVYDAAGNLVQTIDPNGARTTRWYDGNGRVLAELKGDNGYCEYAYNAAGEVSGKTEYTEHLPATAHVPNLVAGDNNRPLAPADDLADPQDVRYILYAYDRAGRATGALYLNPIQITNVTDSGTADPAVNSYWTSGNFNIFDPNNINERSVYDAYGNEVETFDRAGNRTLHYYDVKGRRIASVDPAGYLTTWSYDAAGNPLERRVYAEPYANPELLTADGIELLPPGEVHVTAWRYDAASRLVEEIAPEVEVLDQNSESAYTTTRERLHTTYTHDQAGNILSKTVGAGTPEAQTEYYFYDGANRRIGMLDSRRVLTLYIYDGNGNRIEERRLYGDMPEQLMATVQARTLTVDFLANLINAFSWQRRPEDDQVTTYGYDPMNRLERETDFVQINPSGQPVLQGLEKSYQYDAAGNRTWVRDEDGNVTTTEYDGMGRVRRTIVPGTIGTFGNGGTRVSDASGVYFEYDGVGNLIRVFNGPTAYTAVPADNVNASLGLGYGAVITPADGAVPSGSAPPPADNVSASMETGAVGSAPPAAANISAEIRTDNLVPVVGTGPLPPPAQNVTTTLEADGLHVNWEVTDSSLESYVVYGFDSSESPTGYVYRTPAQTGATGELTAGLLTTTDPRYTILGRRIYYRVVTEDAAGNISYTEERTIVTPPHISWLRVNPQTDGAHFTVYFNGPIESASVLLYDASGNLLGTTPLTEIPPNTYFQGSPRATSYRATIVNPAARNYAITWNVNGATYISARGSVTNSTPEGAYHYQVYATGTVPANYGAVDFDDSGFARAEGSFGGDIEPTAPHVRPTTYWAGESEIVLRRYVSLPPGATGVRIGVVNDNDVEVFVNGVNITDVLIRQDQSHQGVYGTWREFAVPDNVLVAGENVIAIRARDDGGRARLDVWLSGSDLGDVPVLATWVEESFGGAPFETVSDTQASGGTAIRLTEDVQPSQRLGAWGITGNTLDAGRYRFTLRARTETATAGILLMNTSWDSWSDGLNINGWVGGAGGSFDLRGLTPEMGYQTFTIETNLPGTQYNPALALSGLWPGLVIDTVTVERLTEAPVAGVMSAVAVETEASGRPAGGENALTFARGANPIAVSWSVSGTTQQSYVVYDIESHTNIVSPTDVALYGHESDRVTGTTGTVSANIGGDLAPGDVLYFRVVTLDADGDMTWSAEQSVSIPPPRLTTVRIISPRLSATDGNWAAFSVDFDGPVYEPEVAVFNSAGVMSVNRLYAQADGSYLTPAVFTPQTALSYVIRWRDAAGNIHSTPTTGFRRTGEVGAFAITTSTEQSGGTGAYGLAVNVTMASAQASQFTHLRAQWRPAGSSGSFGVTTASSNGSSGGNDTFTLYLGGALPAGAYEVVLSGVRANGEAVTLDTYEYTVGPENTGPLTHHAVSANRLAFGEVGDLRVFLSGDGVNEPYPPPMLTSDDRFVIHPGFVVGSSRRMSIYNRRESATPYSFTVTSSNPGGATTDFRITLTLDPAEAARVGPNGIRIYWYRLGMSPFFSSTFALEPTATPGVYEAVITGQLPGEYSASAHYLDRDGHQVSLGFSVDGVRVSSSIETLSGSGYTTTSINSWAAADVVLDANGVLRVVDLSYAAGDVYRDESLALTETGEPGGSSLNATAEDGAVRIQWNVSGSTTRSYIVYDIEPSEVEPRERISDYAHQINAPSANGPVSVTIRDLSPGDVVHFRIVTVDDNESITWTAEHTATVPSTPGGSGELALAVTGDSGSSLGPALATSTFGARLEVGSNPIRIDWNVASGAWQTWVVYDVVSHPQIDDLDDYDFESLRSDVTSGPAFAYIGDDLPTGSTIYFRVVTADRNGSLAWTAEESITLPPRAIEIQTVELSASTITLRVRFDAPIYQAVLRYGAPGDLSSSRVMTETDGAYLVTLDPITTEGLGLALQWTTTNGVVYTSEETQITGGSFSVIPLIAGFRLDRQPVTGSSPGNQLATGTQAGYYFEYTYNALNHVIATNANDGLYREFGVDANGNVTETRLYGVQRGPVGAQTGRAITTHAAYDARNRKTADFGPTVYDGETGTNTRIVERYEYDVNDRRTLRIDARGNEWRYAYNALGALISEVDPLLGDKRTRYDRFGREVASISRANRVTRKYYDAVGDLVRVRDAEDGEIGYRYDLFGRLIAQTDGRGMQTTDIADDYTTFYYYDQRNRLIRMEEAQGWHLAHFDHTALDPQLTQEQRDYINELYGNERVGLLGAGARDLASLTEEQRNQLKAYYSVVYDYNGRDQRIQTTRRGQVRYEDYDSVGRVWRTRINFNDSGAPAFEDEGSNSGVFADWRTYDSYGNVRAEIKDAYLSGDPAYVTDSGFRTTYQYGPFGRRTQETDPDGNITYFEYDDFGRVIREWSPAAPTGAAAGTLPKDIRKTYDDAGRLTLIEDRATGVTTIYTYYLTGQRRTEGIRPSGTWQGTDRPNFPSGVDHFTHNRNFVYEYDDAGRLVRWEDTYDTWFASTAPDAPAVHGGTGAHLNYLYDADGNVTDVYTDAVAEQAWSPMARANSEPYWLHYRYLTDQAGRVIQQSSVASDGSSRILASYDYDAAGNRIILGVYQYASGNIIEEGVLAPPAGTLIGQADLPYAYDANSRVVFHDEGGRRQVWQYDTRGNTTTFAVFDQDNLINPIDLTITMYNEADRPYWVRSARGEIESDGSYRPLSDQITHYDYYNPRSIQRTKVVDDLNDTEYTYRYMYWGDGREQSVTLLEGTGGAYGNTALAYDANKQLVYINRGRGQEQQHDEIERYVRDNEGHILFKDHVNSVDESYLNDWGFVREYLYVNGNPVGEAGFDADSNWPRLILGQGAYSQIKNYDASFPGAASSYVVRAGDTLQSIASLIFGDPSLWFVIADANGLTGSAPLLEGTTLRIPQSVRNSAFTVDTHKVYNEGDIYKSLLPNVRTPPPPKRDDGCAMITAIVITVVLAAVAGAVTGGVGAAIAGVFGQGLAAALATTAVTGAIGAGVYGATSIARQGIFLGIRELSGGDWYGGKEYDFDWGEVENDAVSGFFTGASLGLGSYAKAAKDLSDLSKIAITAGGIGIRATGAYVNQQNSSGRLTSWTSIATAGIAGGLYTGGNAGLFSSDLGFGLSHGLEFVSPWAQIVETKLRYDDDPAKNRDINGRDIAGALSANIGQGFALGSGLKSRTTGGSARDDVDFGTRFHETSVRILSGVALAHAFSGNTPQERAARDQAIYRTIGQEVGQFLGGYARIPGKAVGKFLGGHLQAGIDYLLNLKDRNAANQWHSSTFFSVFLGAGGETQWARDANGRILGEEFLPPIQRDPDVDFSDEPVIIRVGGERSARTIVGVPPASTSLADDILGDFALDDAAFAGLIDELAGEELAGGSGGDSIEALLADSALSDAEFASLVDRLVAEVGTQQSAKALPFENTLAALAPFVLASNADMARAIDRLMSGDSGYARDILSGLHDIERAAAYDIAHVVQSPRFSGALKTVGGVGEIVTGGAVIVKTGGLLTYPGALLVGKGTDDTVAGIRQVWTGKPTDSFLLHQAKRFGTKTGWYTPETAENVDFWVSVAGTGALSFTQAPVRAAARKGFIGAVNAATYAGPGRLYAIPVHGAAELVRAGGVRMYPLGQKLMARAAQTPAAQRLARLLGERVLKGNIGGPIADRLTFLSDGARARLVPIINRPLQIFPRAVARGFQGFVRPLAMKPGQVWYPYTQAIADGAKARSFSTLWAGLRKSTWKSPLYTGGAVAANLSFWQQVLTKDYQSLDDAWKRHSVYNDMDQLVWGTFTAGYLSTITSAAPQTALQTAEPAIYGGGGYPFRTALLAAKDRTLWNSAKWLARAGSRGAVANAAVYVALNGKLPFVGEDKYGPLALRSRIRTWATGVSANPKGGHADEFLNMAVAFQLNFAEYVALPLGAKVNLWDGYPAGLARGSSPTFQSFNNVLRSVGVLSYLKGLELDMEEARRKAGQ